MTEARPSRLRSRFRRSAAERLLETAGSALLGGALVLGSQVFAQTAGTQNRITQAINNAKLTRLKGNTLPLARPEFDHGPAPASLPMQRMLLVLTRSSQQQAALENLLEQQETKGSVNYHKWLTPAQFGQQFGPSDQNIQTIVAWLESQGFQVNEVSNGGGVIEFSGNAGLVQAAFHTAIHSYVVNGVRHWANASDPQIPSALAPVVAGIDSLNNFPKTAMHEIVGVFQKLKNGRVARVNAPQPGSGASPLYSTDCETDPINNAPLYCNAVTPYDFATIYNVLPLWNAATPIDGTGQSLAIVARSNINLQDVANFRSSFGLPANPPQVILDGPDPGLVNDGDETEADLDVEWSGAVARGATIKLVVSESTEATDGVDLSAEYIVDNDVAPIMSESFGDCELVMGTAGNQFYKDLWQQAAAEGISVFVSTGDEGSSGCDFFQGTTPEAAQDGLQVNGIASTPYNVAVGGTDFNDFFSGPTYWTLNNNTTTQESAKGYIPEVTWDDSCTSILFYNSQFGLGNNAETNCNNPQLRNFVLTIGGSGGVSGCTTPSGTTPGTCSGGYLKPAWQTGSGVPGDNKRDLPDVSLFAGNGFENNFYAICEADQQGYCSSAGNFLGIGGTSVSSPAFAGLMALISQKQGAAQGDPNFILYKLAGMQTGLNCNSSTGPASGCTFNDVTSGTIAMPCVTGSPNCKTATSGDQYGILSGYNAGTGYDLATGLGSVNANNLVTNWGNVKFTPSSTTLTLNGGKAVSITHGSPISVSVSVTPTTPNMPTGDVALIATQGNNTFGFDTMTLSSGTASSTTNLLPGGSSYTVKAHYEGDVNYGGSYSTPVTVTVTPEASQTAMRLITFDPASGQVTNPNAGTVVYGSPYLLRADVTNSSGNSCVNATSLTQTYACPTGNVSVMDNGSALAGGPFGLNSQGYTEDQTIQLTGGSHNLAANYSGDNSYNPSSTSDAISVTPAPTTTMFTCTAQTALIGNFVYLCVATQSQSAGVAPTGSYTVFDNGTALSPTVISQNGSPGSSVTGANLFEQFQVTLPGPPGVHTITATYSGDGNYQSSAAPGFTVTELYATTMTATASPANVILGNNVTITATVSTNVPASNASLKPTGTVSFAGVTGNVNTVVNPGPNGDWQLQSTITFAPQQTTYMGLAYSGDSNYAGSSTTVPVIVTIPDFSVAAGSAPLVVTAGQTGTETLTITPLTSYASTVQLSCGSGLSIPGATCSISPTSVTLSNSAAATATLSVATMAPSTALSARTLPTGWRDAPVGPLSTEEWWTLSLLAGIAALALLLGDGKRRSLQAAWGLGLVCIVTFAIGCGGGAGASSPPPGPVPTTTTISAASTKVPQNLTLTLNAKVTSTQTVTGSVTIGSANCNLASGGTVTGGALQVGFNPILPAGTCAFQAQYFGDQNNQSSVSGTLNIAITGSASLQVVGQTSTDVHTIPINVTIQ